MQVATVDSRRDDESAGNGGHDQEGIHISPSEKDYLFVGQNGTATHLQVGVAYGCVELSSTGLWKT